MVACEGTAPTEKPVAEKKPVVERCATSTVTIDGLTHTTLLDDCNTLLSIRDTLAGSGTLNWSADRSISQWDGIDIDVEETPTRVTGLDLNSQGLTGTIPPELSQLDQLENLYLVENQLMGSIPGELGDLSELERLGLWRNNLTGSIPSELGRIKKLQILALGENRISGPIPAEIGDMESLDYLSLTRNDVTGPLPMSLLKLTNCACAGARRKQLRWVDSRMVGAISRVLKDCISGKTS